MTRRVKNETRDTAQKAQWFYSRHPFTMYGGFSQRDIQVANQAYEKGQDEDQAIKESRLKYGERTAEEMESK